MSAPPTPLAPSPAPIDDRPGARPPPRAPWPLKWVALAIVLYVLASLVYNLLTD